MITRSSARRGAPGLVARALAMLAPALLAACASGGGASGTGSGFIDPSGMYDVSIEQTIDTCSDPSQLGVINWGGATLTLVGNMLRVDIPSEPGATTCSSFTAIYLSNAVQAGGNQQVTDGTCTYKETLSVALMFTDMGFTGSYTTVRERIAGTCPAQLIPSCTLAGTITGDEGMIGTPSCP